MPPLFRGGKRMTGKKMNKKIKEEKEEKEEKLPIVPLDKLVGNFIHINELTTFKYGLGNINLDTFHEKNKQTVITKDMNIFDIENAIFHNLLFISDKKGKDITEKFYKNYKPSEVHIWKNPKSIFTNPRESKLSILLEDSIDEHKFLSYIEKLEDNDFVLLHNLFKNISEKTYLQKLKEKAIKRLFNEIKAEKN